MQMQKYFKKRLIARTSYDFCYQMLIDSSYECLPVCLLDVVG